MGTTRRNTKLGIGAVGGPATQAARMRGSLPPQQITCPAPRVPRFDDAGSTEPKVPPPSGARRRKTSLRPNAVDEVDTAGIAVVAKVSTPRPAKKKKDLASAPIDNREAFLLTRIDGQLNVEDLADLTGMPLAEVLTIVQRLARLGLIIL